MLTEGQKRIFNGMGLLNGDRIGNTYTISLRFFTHEPANYEIDEGLRIRLTKPDYKKRGFEYIELSPEETKTIAERRLQELKERGIERELTMLDFYTDEQIANNIKNDSREKYSKFESIPGWKPENYTVPENEEAIRELEEIIDDINSMTAPEKVDRERLIQHEKRMRSLRKEYDMDSPKTIKFYRKHGMQKALDVVINFIKYAIESRGETEERLRRLKMARGK